MRDLTRPVVDASELEMSDAREDSLSNDEESSRCNSQAVIMLQMLSLGRWEVELRHGRKGMMMCERG